LILGRRKVFAGRSGSPAQPVGQLGLGPASEAGQEVGVRDVPPQDRLQRLEKLGIERGAAGDREDGEAPPGLLERSGARQGLDPEERHRKLVGAGALGGEEGRGVLEGPSGLFVTSRLEERSSEIGADEGVDRGASLTADLAEGAGVLPSGLLRPPDPEQAAADAVQDGGVGVPPLGGGERGERGAELDERLVVAPEIRQGQGVCPRGPRALVSSLPKIPPCSRLKFPPPLTGRERDGNDD